MSAPTHIIDRIEEVEEHLDRVYALLSLCIDRARSTLIDANGDSQDLCLVRALEVAGEAAGDRSAVGALRKALGVK